MPDSAVKVSTGRLCACGCLKSIDHLRANAKRMPGCQWLRERQRESERAKTRTRVRDRSKKNIVAKPFKADLPRSSQRPCLVCAGMPWARTPERTTDDREGYQARVVNDNGLCRGCGEPYAPEPRPEGPSLLCSSAGTAVRASDMNGQEVAPGRGIHQLR